MHPFLTAYDALTTRTLPATTIVAEEETGFSVLNLLTGPRTDGRPGYQVRLRVRE